jgi:hypothetical protein
VVEMVKKLVISRLEFISAYDELDQEIDRNIMMKKNLLDFSPYDGSELSVLLNSLFNELSDRSKFLFEIMDLLANYVVQDLVIEVVEVVEVVEVSKSSYAKKINQVREDLMKSQESIFFRETIEILKEFTDEQSSNVLHQLLGWFYKDDEFLGKMKEFALEELGKKRGRENSES